MPELRLEIAKDGNLVPLLDGISLHSRYVPVAEGRKIAESLSDGQGDPVVFGVGFGYHLLPLLECYPKIFVYEPEPALQELVRQHSTCRDWVERIHWLRMPEDAIPGSPYLALPASRRLYPDAYARFQERLSSPAESTPEIDFSRFRVLLDYPVYGGSHTTATYIEHALKQLGCQVESIDNAFAEPVLQRILEVSDATRSGRMAEKLTELLSELYRVKFEDYRPQIALFTAQSPVTIPVLRSLREPAATAFWFVEDYRRFAYWRDYAREFDLFAGIQRGDFPAELHRRGALDPIYLPMAADETVHRPLTLTPEQIIYYGSDVSFMGAGYPNRHRLFNELTGFDLKIWGTGWNSNPRLAPYVGKSGQRVGIEESVMIYNAAKININLHSSMESDYFEADGDFLNPRTFEIMACGGFQLTDRRSLLSELFVEDNEIVTFSSLPELKEKLAFYLTHPEERTRIAENGRRRVLHEHTYTHRLRVLLQALVQRRPDILEKIAHEENNLQAALERIHDPGLNEFIASIPSEHRNSLPHLVEAARKDTGKLSQHQAMLMLLETFAGDDGCAS